VRQFENDLAHFLSSQDAVAVSSGTAALHLALRLAAVGSGDLVVVPTVTFAATAFAVQYLGAVPVLVDVDEDLNLDPATLETALCTLSKRGTPLKACVPVDMYGYPANYKEITPILEHYKVTLVQDAAESLGSLRDGFQAGTQGIAGAISFNGNKIMTTGGGGAVSLRDHEDAVLVRKWCNQSRESVKWYQHHELGYNYRMSSVSAAIGSSQLASLPTKIAGRRRVRSQYAENLNGKAGLKVPMDATNVTSNAWLTRVQLDTHASLPSISSLIQGLADFGVEARYSWKPLHRQPHFADCPAFLTGAADASFASNLLMPSTEILTVEDIECISDLLLKQVSKGSPLN